MYFGKYVKSKRQEKNISLKEFTNFLGLPDMSWWAKVENGKMPTPDRPELFKKISAYLNLNEEENNVMFELSAAK